MWTCSSVLCPAGRNTRIWASALIPTSASSSRSSLNVVSAERPNSHTSGRTAVAFDEAEYVCLFDVNLLFSAQFHQCESLKKTSQNKNQQSSTNSWPSSAGNTAAGSLSSSSNFQTCSQSVFTNKLTFLFIIFIYSQSFLLFNLLAAFNSAFFTRTNETVTLHRESTDWYGDNSHGLK